MKGNTLGEALLLHYSNCVYNVVELLRNMRISFARNQVWLQFVLSIPFTARIAPSFADANSSSKVNTTCRVYYKSALSLHCPNVTNTTSTMWWKMSSSGKKAFICDAADCTIDSPLHNENSGQYFCEVFGSFGEKDYYVNVTILGKPLGNLRLLRFNTEWSIVVP